MRVGHVYSKQKRLFCIGTMAAFGSNCSHAFSPLQQQLSPPTPFLSVPTTTSTTTATRLYSSRNNDNNNDDKGGVLDTLKGAAKNVLPFLKSDEEKQAAMERKRVKKEVKGGIQEILKDAPLPVKMLGSVIAPILSSAASSMAETMGQQQRALQELLDQAQVSLVRDPQASQALGEPITVGAPFSQSSSTMMVNGVTTTQVQAAFNVMGSKNNGVCQMSATGEGIESLVLNVNGRSINVNLSSSSGGGTTVIGGTSSSSSTSFSNTRLGKNPKNAGDVIDVEFVEKDDNDDKK